MFDAVLILVWVKFKSQSPVRGVYVIIGGGLGDVENGVVIEPHGCVNLKKLDINVKRSTNKSGKSRMFIVAPDKRW